MSDKWEAQYFGNLSRDGTDDRDADGLPDAWEEAYGLDPNDDGSGLERNGRMIVGIPYEWQGVARIYDKDARTGRWKLSKALTGNSPEGGGKQFGWSVDIAGDYAVVAQNVQEPFINIPSYVFMYKRSTEGQWELDGQFRCGLFQCWSVGIARNYGGGMMPYQAYSLNTRVVSAGDWIRVVRPNWGACDV